MKFTSSRILCWSTLGVLVLLSLVGAASAFAVERPENLGTLSGRVTMAPVTPAPAKGPQLAGQATAPVIDGNIDDLIALADDLQANGGGCGLDIDDPSQDVAVVDPLVEPCVPIVANYYVNGFDMVKVVVVQFQGKLYLGMRVAGIVGDPDGDGDPNTSCPGTNVPEQPGIGDADSYKWFLDTNCSSTFSPDVTMTLTANKIFLAGIVATGSGIAAGHDIEIELDNATVGGNPLGLFSARGFAGNTFDGLGEDLSAVLQCPPPDLSIDLTKSVEPSTVCAGNNTAVKLSVHNTSEFRLDPVEVKDTLPAGFTYVAGSSNVGDPGIVGQVLTFATFGLDPDATKDITFSIKSPVDCFGEVTNQADVSGRLTSDCLPAPGYLDAIKHAEATITCSPGPCVNQIVATATESACPGDPIKVCVKAHNCSKAIETIHIFIGSTQKDFPDVAPDATVEYCLDGTMPDCQAGGNVCFTYDATAENECGSTSDGLALEKCIACKECLLEACPRTIGFWRQQCAQKTGGSTKVCLAGMYNLWTCVLGKTGVISWKNNDGSFTKTASLGALSQANLFAFFCGQLQGPRPMTLRDMTEIQYLGLMLNVCSGALPLNIPIDNGFTGTVGEAITAIENAINTNTDLGKWEKVADDINNRLGVLAKDCPLGDNLFRNLPPCGVVIPPDAGSIGSQGTSVGGDFATRNYPNPILDRSTTIFYSVPDRAGRAPVEIAVFDAGGRLVTRLVSSEKSPGSYTVDWDLNDDAGNSVSSGIYFYRVVVGGEKITQKMLVIRK